MKEVTGMECSFYEYSFIVPVYNAEKYIDECIQSILKQGERCEIILVDDGSTDASGEICDVYAQQHKRIKVFHNKNSGPAAARNFGLEKACGNYVVFVDSDDYISSGLIEHLECGYADKTQDLIFYNIVKNFPDGRLEPMSEGLAREKIHGKTIDEVLKAISQCSKFPASTGGKIIKRDVLTKNNIKFKEGIMGEDIDWTLQLISNINSADVYQDESYYYRISPNTRRSYGNSKSLLDQLSIIEEWTAAGKGANKYILSFLAYQYAVSLPFYGALAAEEREMYSNRVKKLRFLLSYGNTTKIKLIRLAVNLLGITTASKLLYQYVVKRDETNA